MQTIPTTDVNICSSPLNTTQDERLKINENHPDGNFHLSSFNLTKNTKLTTPYVTHSR